MLNFITYLWFFLDNSVLFFQHFVGSERTLVHVIEQYCNYEALIIGCSLAPVTVAEMFRIF